MNMPITAEDSIPEYMNVLGMIFSMCGLMMRVSIFYFSKIISKILKLKWCAWLALICSCVSFANVRANDDAKQTVSSFMYWFFYVSIISFHKF